MSSKRIFDLPQMRGSFNIRGRVTGTEKNNFYSERATKNGSVFRNVNFGVTYDNAKTVYLTEQGMPRDKVYFSKRNPSTGKTETKSVAWADRNKFNEDGWRMIGVGLGLKKTTNSEGKEVNDKKLMLVGVDTSYCTENGQRKLKVAFLATINKEFTKYNAQKYLLNSDYSHDTFLPLKKYLFIAITEYFKENKEFPKGIVIYRQGVSQEQKKILKTEIECINDLLNGSSEELQIAIPYYYVLVNKKCNYKFFESPIKQQGKNNRGNKYQNDTFINPDPGLLVYKNIVDPTIFEFYIQPQKVTSGTATPTNFHVAYGNLNYPKLIPKLTYELCYLYSNWRGPVRIPAPLKYAEKLAKVDPKVHDKIKNTLSFI